MTVSESLEIITAVIFITVSIKLVQIDLRIKRLPNLIVIPTTLIIFTLLLINQYISKELGNLWQILSLPLIVTSLFFIISFLYPRGLGMGDIKVIFLIGIVLTPSGSSLFILSLATSFIAGAIFALVARIQGSKDQEFAFGPFLLLPAMAILSSQLL